MRIIEGIVGPLTIRNGLSWLFLIVGVFTIWWLLFQPFVIPSGSMEPTLHGVPGFFRGDRVFVNKLIFGPRIPFTNIRICQFKKPQRWDIIVFRPVEKDSPNPVLIKRIVGLPGERIEIKDGYVWANGKRQDPPEDLRDVLHYTRYLGDGEEYLMKLALDLALATAASHELKGMTESEVMALKNPDLQRLYDALPQWIRDAAAEQLERQYPNRLRYGVRTEDAYSVVPPDCYFVLGDNSPDSGDGRLFGWLPGGHILGRASCIFWPIPRARDFTGFWHTWKGKTLLYGIPALIIAIEALNHVRRRKKGRTQQPV